MKTAWMLMILLAGAAVAGPTVTAQDLPSPVEKCTKQCNPKDADVNGADIKKGSQPVTSVMYGHFEDLLNLVPFNTQFPDPAWERDLNGGFLMPILDTNLPACVPGTQTCANFHFKNNQFQGYFSPGMVEYLQEGWRTHQEPGLAADVKILGDEIILYWYMSAHSIPNANTNQPPGSQVRVGFMPQVGVYARMETGRFPFKDNLVIAESVDFAGNQFLTGPSRTNMLTHPGEARDVYEFRVVMKVTQASQGIIPSDEIHNGILIYVNPYQYKDHREFGQQIGQNEWRLRTGPKFLPRIIIPAERVMETKAASLSIFDEKLFVRWSLVSMWGSYDLRDQALSLRSTGQNPIDPKAIELIILKRSIDHDGHFKPVNATWAIDFHKYALPDGEYELTASIPNLQETYLLEQKFNFTVKNGRPQVTQIGQARSNAGGGVFNVGADGAAPAFDALLLAVSLVAVAAVVATRRRE